MTRLRTWCCLRVRVVRSPMTRLRCAGRRGWPRRARRASPQAGRLDRRLSALGNGRRSGDDRVVYRGLGVLGGSFSASCATLSTVLARAGLGDEPDVRPVSITAWAGHRILTETVRIDDVARALGMPSLDRAARLIGWDWHTDETT
jgi:hypothetical protein